MVVGGDIREEKPKGMPRRIQKKKKKKTGDIVPGQKERARAIGLQSLPFVRSDGRSNLQLGGGKATFIEPPPLPSPGQY